MNRLGVVIYGCGVIGRKTAEALFAKKSLEIVGAIDAAPELKGRDLGALFEKPQDTGVAIRDDAQKLLSETKARAVVLTTSSHLQTVLPQIAQCTQAGLNVVSTCEELAYPWVRSPALAAKTDELARQHGVTVVGTGINPGFLMDTLPVVLTAPCLRVDAIRVTRMMNSAKRRIPFQKKVGTGLSPAEFAERIQSGAITGHVGLLESMNLIAAALGWSLEETIETPPRPVLADKALNTPAGPVQPGQVIGLTSLAYGSRNGRRAIELAFHANAGVVEEYDEIVIEGLPRIHQKILGGVHGDIGTVAVTINTIPRAVAAPAGLLTMKDLPPAAAVP